MDSDKKITIFLADDHAMVREGLAALVGDDPEIEVVGQTGDGLKVVDMVRQLRPNVVVLDITMPGLNGLDVCRDIIKRAPGTAVLVLTMHDDEQFIAKSLQIGALGYLLKEAAAGEFTQALRTVAKGEIFLSPGIPKAVLERIGQPEEEDPQETLTSRERQVLQLIAEGKTNRQISEELELSQKTIDTHRSHLMRKLNIHDQTSLVKYAIRKGIVPLK